MRILIAAGIFPPDIGGPATYASVLADELVARGHTVRVLAYGDTTDVMWRGSRFLVRRVGRGKKTVTYCAYLWHLFHLAFESDIIYAQGPVAGGLQSMIISKLVRIPFVVKITGDYAWEQHAGESKQYISVDDFQSSSVGLSTRVKMLKFIQKAVVSRARYVIVPSQYLRKIVERWGIAHEKVIVIYNAAESSRGAELTADVKNQYSISGPLVFCAARLVPWKGLDAVLDAWSLVSKEYPAARCIIAGGGPDEKKLAAKIIQNNLSGSATMIGRISPAEMRSWLATAAIFVLNSGYEGFSHSILEAQHAGVTCAVSDVGGNPELVQQNVTGVLFGYNDINAIATALRKLLGDPIYAGKLATNAQKNVREFSLDRMHKETEQLLKRVAASST